MLLTCHARQLHASGGTCNLVQLLSKTVLKPFAAGTRTGKKTTPKSGENEIPGAPQYILLPAAFALLATAHSPAGEAGRLVEPVPAAKKDFRLNISDKNP